MKALKVKIKNVVSATNIISDHGILDNNLFQTASNYWLITGKEAIKEHWYYSRGWINGKLCKKCFIKKSIETRNILISKGWKRKNYKSKNKSI